jgi:glycosyltransferase involved in cell wall biosynthesis
MKILMIAPEPFLEPRGTPISIYQRLKGLSSLGHEVDLVTYHIGSDIDIPQVTIYRTPQIFFIKKVRIGPSLAKLLLDIFLFLKALWMLLIRRYDVIHSHEEAAFFTVFLGAIFRIPHVYDMHSSMPQQLKNFNFGNTFIIIKLFELLEDLVLKTCNVVLTIGSDLEDYVLSSHPKANHIRIENIAVQENLILNKESAAEIRNRLQLNGRLCIVYTGNFENYQGLDLLFKSVKIVTKRFPEVAFVMVGGRPDQVSHWKKVVEKEGLMDTVIFVGTVSLEESQTFLEIADILISPRTEGLSVPLKLYSYMRSGKPIVATQIIAHTQILNDLTAVITEINPGAYAAGILELIKDENLRSRIGQEARTMAEEAYSEKNYRSKLEKAFYSVQHSVLINDVQLQPEKRAEQLLTPTSS